LSGFETIDIDVGDVTLTVAAAETTQQRARGLMEVESLPPGMDGMLFDFGGAASASFQMRNTVIPLDIWWFEPGGRLIGVTTMTPCEAEPCESYESPGEIGWALETPAGEIALTAGAQLSTGEKP
jgi:hypothetical protein